ncbi:MAG: ribosome-binding factor A [Patescibacteria group bacterium]
MNELKEGKTREAIQHAAAEFLSAASNRTSLITVTGVRLSRRGDRATIAVTVFPKDKEEKALEFARRQGGALRDFIAKRVSLMRLPYIAFALDVGEKNRQRLDELSSD